MIMDSVIRHAQCSVARDVDRDIAAIEQNRALYEEDNYLQRVVALDALEFAIMANLDGSAVSGHRRELAAAGRRARTLRDQLEEVDRQLFAGLRAEIRTGHCVGPRLLQRLAALTGYPTSVAPDALGYDALDVLVNGIWLTEPAPEETRAREPEMVFYQPTPARIVWQMIERVGFQKSDVFYDLGSGLGHVPMLVNACTGTRARGIEYEPAYCATAQRCASDLHLDGVEFINADVRDADFSDGTVFFMYTPFRGKILRQVLEKLRGQTQRKCITLCTYGAIALPISRCTWLARVDWREDEPSGLVIFRSLATRK
jgi:hypothetical protein